MRNEDEIFEEYALKRLMEDNNLGLREYLDSSEFDLATSSSLDFLAKETEVSIQSPSPKWITEESSEENGSDYYRDEPERVYVITVADILQTRHENMERILQKLPKSLASKIKAFEKDTKHLYTPSLSSSADIVDGLKNILKQSEDNSVIQRLVISHAKRILPEQSKQRQNTLAHAKEKLAKKQAAQNRFYALIKDIHDPKNKNNRINLYLQLLKELKNQNKDDASALLTNADYKLTSVNFKKRLTTLKRQMTTELTRDIYEQLHKLYNQAGMLHNVKDLTPILENYNDACARYEGRLLGKKGAFEKGGFYGPDSKFSGLTQKTQSASAGMLPKEEKYVQLKIFDDADFEY